MENFQSQGCGEMMGKYKFLKIICEYHIVKRRRSGWWGKEFIAVAGWQGARYTHGPGSQTK